MVLALPRTHGTGVVAKRDMTQRVSGTISSSVPHLSDSKNNDSTNPQSINSSMGLNTRNDYFSEDDDT